MSKPVTIPLLSVLMALLFVCGSIRPLPASCLPVTGTAMQDAAKPSHEREEATLEQEREEDETRQERQEATLEQKWEEATPEQEREEVTPEQEREEDETEQLRERLAADYGEKANQVIDHYVRAQQAFFQERYQQALQEIDSALALIETADLLAFKGAIYFGMGQVEEAAKAFTRAFSLDKELPVPRVQGLHGWLTDNNLMP